MEDFNTPSPTPASEEEHESKLDPFKSLIDEWLEADKLAPRKQRHTAKRIYRRLRDEAEVFNCSYRLVALYVAEKKEKLPLCIYFNPIRKAAAKKPSRFTFHYVSISTFNEFKTQINEIIFTFHYVSISTCKICAVLRSIHIYIPLCIYFNHFFLIQYS